MGSRFMKRFGPVMTAASQVFAIPELLENVLLYLPERDLLLAQRVQEIFPRCHSRFRASAKKAVLHSRC